MEDLELVNSTIENNVDQINIKVNKAVLLKALSHVQSIVEKRNIIPILSNVKIIAENNLLELVATDMDINVSESIPAEVIIGGSFTVSAHTFYDIVKKLPDDSPIELVIDPSLAGRLNINCELCKFSLPFLPAFEFPIMDYGEVNQEFNILPEELIYLIDKSKFAISVEETRYNLNGIYFHTVKEEDNISYLIAAATDGHRLSKVKIGLSENIEDIAGIIIPRKAILEVRKLLESAKEPVKISLSLSKIKFDFGNINLISKLIDANFPEYENLIPYDNEKILELDVKSFSKAIDRVSIINFDRLRAVKFLIDNNKLLISASSEVDGNASEELDAVYSFETITIGFNSKYLLDVMSVIEGNNVLIKLKDNYSPVMITDKDDKASIYVLMPMVV